MHIERCDIDGCTHERPTPGHEESNPKADMSAPEWHDFQDQLDGTFKPTLLPIGPDCLRKHPEFLIGLVK